MRSTEMKKSPWWRFLLTGEVGYWEDKVPGKNCNSPTCAKEIGDRQMDLDWLRKRNELLEGVATAARLLMARHSKERIKISDEEDILRTALADLNASENQS
jgi:hypothetical protein